MPHVGYLQLTGCMKVEETHIRVLFLFLCLVSLCCLVLFDPTQDFTQNVFFYWSLLFHMVLAAKRQNIKPRVPSFWETYKTDESELRGSSYVCFWRNQLWPPEHSPPLQLRDLISFSSLSETFRDYSAAKTHLEIRFFYILVIPFRVLAFCWSCFLLPRWLSELHAPSEHRISLWSGFRNAALVLDRLSSKVCSQFCTLDSQSCKHLEHVHERECFSYLWIWCRICLEAHLCDVMLLMLKSSIS